MVVGNAMSADEDVVLCVNAGSSSVKLALFRAAEERLETMATASIQGLGGGQARLTVRRGAQVVDARDAGQLDHEHAIATALPLLEKVAPRPISVVGHRIVHGGARYLEPTLVDETVLSNLRELVALAPLHLPSAIACIELVTERFPGIRQVACFDTAFHARMPEVARRLPLPESFDRAGVRRYGFHGLSFEYVMSTFEQPPPHRVVIAHLGNGASLVAVENGKSIDTTMGFTPAGGVMMGTRSGDLDPGVLVYLLRQLNVSVGSLASILEREAGLVAVGGTSDMKELLASTEPKARLAVAMFCNGIRKAIAGLASVLGGIDVLVFTGGIGENAAVIREGICDGLGFMGIEIDREKNMAADDVVSSRSSTCKVRVVKTDEDAMIANHALRVRRALG